MLLSPRTQVGSVSQLLRLNTAGTLVCRCRGHRNGLFEADHSLLGRPVQRQFDMRGEFQIGQFSTLGDRLDDFGREKRQPDEAGSWIARPAALRAVLVQRWRRGWCRSHMRIADVREERTICGRSLTTSNCLARLSARGSTRGPEFVRAIDSIRRPGIRDGASSVIQLGSRAAARESTLRFARILALPAVS